MRIRINKAFLFILIFVACTSSTDKLIEEYERTENKIIITKIIAESAYTPFLAKDSIEYINESYDLFLQNKLSDLQQQWEETNQKWLNGLSELQTISNPLMKKAFASRVDIIEQDKIKIEKIISIYRNTPEITELGRYISKRKKYKIKPDSLIGYRITYNFTGLQGTLPKADYSKTYLFSPDKTEILGLIQP